MVDFVRRRRRRRRISEGAQYAPEHVGKGTKTLRFIFKRRQAVLPQNVTTDQRPKWHSNYHFPSVTLMPNKAHETRCATTKIISPNSTSVKMSIIDRMIRNGRKS